MERQHQTHCAYCQKYQAEDNEACENCGMPVPLKRVRRFMGFELNFKAFVILLAVFCLVMILILPRTIPS